MFGCDFLNQYQYSPNLHLGLIIVENVQIYGEHPKIPWFNARCSQNSYPFSNWKAHSAIPTITNQTKGLYNNQCLKQCHETPIWFIPPISGDDLGDGFHIVLPCFTIFYHFFFGVGSLLKSACWLRPKVFPPSGPVSSNVRLGTNDLTTSDLSDVKAPWLLKNTSVVTTSRCSLERIWRIAWE